MPIDGTSCPECHSDTLYRSHRRNLDWIFYYLGYLPFRCSDCLERFYAPRQRRRSRHIWARLG
jgi:hypothetical protein